MKKFIRNKWLDNKIILEIINSLKKKNLFFMKIIWKEKDEFYSQKNVILFHSYKYKLFSNYNSIERKKIYKKQ